VQEFGEENLTDYIKRKYKETKKKLPETEVIMIMK
jgi:hypothetical protein